MSTIEIINEITAVFDGFHFKKVNEITFGETKIDYSCLETNYISQKGKKFHKNKNL